MLLQYFNLEKLYPVNDFYMEITTHSKWKLTTLIAAEVRAYVENLIKPLVTNESLEKLLGAFQEKIVKNIWRKIRCAKCKNNKASI